MSFASDARTESAHLLCKQRCCARAELAAALLMCGGVNYHFGANRGISLSLTVHEAASARHFFQLLRTHFGATCRIETLRTNTLQKGLRYRLRLPDEQAQNILEEIGMKDEDALFGVAASHIHCP